MKKPNLAGKREPQTSKPFHMLIFASIETAREMSHINAEDVCPVLAGQRSMGRPVGFEAAPMPRQPCPTQTATTKMGDERFTGKFDGFQVFAAAAVKLR